MPDPKISGNDKFDLSCIPYLISQKTLRLPITNSASRRTSLEFESFFEVAVRLVFDVQSLHFDYFENSSSK